MLFLILKLQKTNQNFIREASTFLLFIIKSIFYFKYLEKEKEKKNQNIRLVYPIIGYQIKVNPKAQKRSYRHSYKKKREKEPRRNKAILNTLYLKEEI